VLIWIIDLARRQGSWLDRRCECSSNGPSLVQPVANCVWKKTNLSSPLCDRQGDVVMSDQVNGSRIMRLLFRECPLNVVRLITFRVIDAVKRVPICRSRTDRLFECLKAGFPLLTDRDTTSAVAMVNRTLRIEASLLHCDPDPMKRSLGFAMRAIAGTARIIVQATTGPRSPLPQCCLPHRQCGAAVTTAPPLREIVRRSRSGSLQKRKTPKSLPDHTAMISRVVSLVYGFGNKARLVVGRVG
jgi:hypothetical protein